MLESATTIVPDLAAAHFRHEAGTQSCVSAAYRVRRGRKRPPAGGWTGSTTCGGHMVGSSSRRGAMSRAGAGNSVRASDAEGWGLWRR